MTVRIRDYLICKNINNTWDGKKNKNCLYNIIGRRYL
jgi:hypothetical protein